MLSYINFVTILFSVILTTQGQTERNIQTRRQDNNITFRPDYTYIEAEMSFYKYHKIQKNWHDANKLCVQEGAQLFYAITKDELDAVVSFWKPKNAKPPHIWHGLNLVYIGISDIVTEGVFITIDGKRITKVYHKWADGQPDNWKDSEDCVQMNQQGMMNDVNCNTTSYFICKKSFKPIEEDTTTNCNNQGYNSTITLKTFVFWPNATVPFYINPDHFGEDQMKVILKSLDMFEFKTCIKFAPLMVAPGEGQHVMTFINPEGVRRCTIETKGHSNYSPHIIQLGYNCMDTRELDMIIMRALGLPFEHNRANRDVYIDVWTQNIEPSYVELFTKDCILPKELQKIPYDPYSIMHFGERDYSKNGHRTIKFKNPIIVQARDGISPADIKKIGLTPSDIKKLALIYGPECRSRDRAAQVAMCRNYPGA